MSVPGCFRAAGRDEELIRGGAEGRSGRTGLEGRELLRHVLRELGSMAAQMDDRVLLAFDEFQEVTRLSGSEGIEGLLRTEIQFQGFAHFFVGSHWAVQGQVRPGFELRTGNLPTNPAQVSSGSACRGHANAYGGPLLQ